MSTDRSDPLYAVVDSLTAVASSAARGIRTRVIAVRKEDDGGIRVRLRPSHRTDESPGKAPEELDAVAQATARTAVTAALRRSLPLAQCFEQTNDLCGQDDVVVKLPSRQLARQRAVEAARKHPFVQALGLCAMMLFGVAGVLTVYGL